VELKAGWSETKKYRRKKGPSGTGEKATLGPRCAVRGGVCATSGPPLSPDHNSNARHCGGKREGGRPEGKREKRTPAGNLGWPLRTALCRSQSPQTSTRRSLEGPGREKNSPLRNPKKTAHRSKKGFPSQEFHVKKKKEGQFAQNKAKKGAGGKLKSVLRGLMTL